MPASSFARQSSLALLMFAFSAGAWAQAQPAQKPFEPFSGQPGKDVVWVPTPQALVDKMLDIAHVTANDYVMDLGSGDGRTVITAAKRGARATGIEYNPDMVELSKRNAEQAGVTGKANFLKADLFETDFSKATVITMFLLPDINLKLRPKILDLKPGTRIVPILLRWANGRMTKPPRRVKKRTAATIAPLISGSCRRKSRARGKRRKASSRSSKLSRWSPAR
jgi:SAM-dependent methyltransferase